MSQRFARLLNDQDLVDHFLTEVLDFDYSGLNNIAYEIIQGEQGLFHLGPMAQTLNTSKFRDRKFYKEADRWALRRQIIEELRKHPMNHIFLKRNVVFTFDLKTNQNGSVGRDVQISKGMA